MTPSQRTFGRPIEFDIACVQCGHAESVREKTPKRVWYPRGARFTCQECGFVMLVGLAVWSAGKLRGGSATPIDQVPTRAEAAALRGKLSLWGKPKGWRVGGEGVNWRGEIADAATERDEPGGGVGGED